MSEEYNCDECDKVYKTKSGLWKHKKAKHSLEEVFKEKEEITEEDKPITEESDDSPSWLDYDSPSFMDEEVTEKIPSELKFASKIAEIPAKSFSRDTNKNLLIIGYGATDQILSYYANAVTAGEIETIVHSKEDKEWTSEITLDWMEQSGVDLTNHLTPGMLAFGANAYYVGAPVHKIQKKSKVAVGAGVGKFASKIPFFGKWLTKRANNKKGSNGLGQNIQEYKIEDGVISDA